MDQVGAEPAGPPPNHDGVAVPDFLLNEMHESTCRILSPNARHRFAGLSEDVWAEIKGLW